jgi:hypothetical protein
MGYLWKVKCTYKTLEGKSVTASYVVLADNAPAALRIAWVTEDDSDLRAVKIKRLGAANALLSEDDAATIVTPSSAT